MQTFSCKKTILILALGAFLTGCGSVYAGTTVSDLVETSEGTLDSRNTLQWFDGIEMVTQEVRVSDVFIKNEADEVIKKYDYSRIPVPDIPGFWAVVNITPSNEGTIPVSLTDKDGAPLVSNGIVSDTTAYYLGDGWYTASVPNMCKEFAFTAADKIFTYKVPEPVTETQPENTAENTEGVVKNEQSESAQADA